MPGEDFLQQHLVFGVGGLDLHHPLDLVPPTAYGVLNNVRRVGEGGLTSRLGQTQLFTTPSSSNVHSIVRVNDIVNATLKRVVGSGTHVFHGVSGALTDVDSGYSGDPLSFVPEHPPLSGESWVYIGDRSRMRKVRASDGLDTPIGLPPPTGALGVGLSGSAAGRRFRLDEFARSADGVIDARDRTRFTSFGFDITTVGSVDLGDLKKTTIDTMDAAGWTNNQGTGTAAPSNATDAVNKKEGTASVDFTTGGGTGAYYNYWAKANVKDLNLVGGAPASDSELIHIWLRTDRPDLIEEVRLYFVVGSSFDVNTVPGTSDAKSTDAYLKTFRPSDFQPLYEASTATLNAAAKRNINQQTLDRLTPVADIRTVGEIVNYKEQRDPSRKASVDLASGRGQWTELGITGLPLYRGEFQRIGNDTSVDWSDVTGLVVLVQISDGTVVNVWIDDIYMHGGSGPDTSVVGMEPYNYRYIHYDPRTGVKGNPSAPQELENSTDAQRRTVNITPGPYGDSAIHQRFYRRGGTLVTDWYLLGENASDGGVFHDTLADADIITAPLVEEDNDQPVTTTDTSTGAAILAQPLPSIFGPVMGIMMGCGDPHRPGHLSFCKQGEFDHWPAVNNVEVCPPAEELMAGAVLAGQGFVFSRLMLYSALVSLSSGARVNCPPTACTKGLISRWGLTPGPDGLYFVSNDGIYRTTGGPAECITENWVGRLFRGETVNGYLPVGFTSPNSIRLTVHENDLWFVYQDTALAYRVLIFSLLFQEWRSYTFARPVSGINSEREGATNATLLLGSADGDDGFTHSGFSDDGVAIVATVKTGALDQTLPRMEKQYGDVVLDLDRQGTTINVVPFSGAEATALQAQTLTSGAGRQRYYVDPIDALAVAGPYRALSLGLTLSWSSSSAAPILYRGAISYIAEPELVVARVTDLSVEGRAVDKWVKGVVLDCDTGGAAKSVVVEIDGVAATTLSATASGRTVLQFAFAQARGRVIRIRPTGTGVFRLYEPPLWIFDEEPLALTRWESQERTDGMDTRVPAFAYIALRSSAQVDLTVTTYRADGTAQADTYVIPSTAGVKIRQYVPFLAKKGVHTKFLLTSSSAFWLYREESVVYVQPWAGGGLVPLHPFGNDDLDLTRAMSNATSAAQRSGGGQGA